MTHASLFSGIGGFDLAAEWAGWTNLFNCEIDVFCRKILKYHFPNATQYADIRTVDFTVWRGRVDVLSGGFPCQPFSLAGKRQGTADDRYLWPEMLRAIRAIRPRWVVGENVYGFVNWSRGMVFEQVCSDLENEGYAVQSYILPACAVAAPHRRDRVWIISRNTDARVEDMQGQEELSDSVNASSNAKGVGRPGRDSMCCKHARRRSVQNALVESPYGQTSWDEFPSQPPVCCRDDGISAELDAVAFPRWQRESIKAYGNAVVPPLVHAIFETINEYEEELN